MRAWVFIDVLLCVGVCGGVCGCVDVCGCLGVCWCVLVCVGVCWCVCVCLYARVLVPVRTHGWCGCGCGCAGCGPWRHVARGRQAPRRADATPNVSEFSLRSVRQSVRWLRPFDLQHKFWLSSNYDRWHFVLDINHRQKKDEFVKKLLSVQFQQAL